MVQYSKSLTHTDEIVFLFVLNQPTCERYVSVWLALTWELSSHPSIYVKYSLEIRAHCGDQTILTLMDAVLSATDLYLENFWIFA